MSKEVWVYRNLRHGKKAKPLYSIMKAGRVVRHVRRILLANCRFVVREGGRQRAIKEGRKNVHAFVVGTPVSSAYGTDKNGRDLPAKVKYNPYKAGQFMWDDHPVKGASVVLINENGVSAAYTC